METVYLIECDDWSSTFSNLQASDVAFTSKELAEEFLNCTQYGFESRIKKVNVFNSVDTAKLHISKQNG